MDPATKALGLPAQDEMLAQVFQIAACNWDCWYCFVPRELRTPGTAGAAWLSPADLLDLYLSEPERPRVIDLSGGQPYLAPEWLPWMMEELLARGLQRQVYLWSDDNLSTGYLWRFLSDDQIALVRGYPAYGHVGCFKGFDAASFSFNTGAHPSLFGRQFRLMGRLLALGVDTYAYTTFTTPDVSSVGEAMKRFVDRLQSLDPNLPLRTVPLRIEVYTPTRASMTEVRRRSIENQARAVEAWAEELRARYASADLGRAITEAHLSRR